MLQVGRGLGWQASCPWQMEGGLWEEEEGEENQTQEAELTVKVSQGQRIHT